MTDTVYNSQIRMDIIPVDHVKHSDTQLTSQIHKFNKINCVQTILIINIHTKLIINN